jgi:transketolase
MSVLLAEPRRTFAPYGRALAELGARDERVVVLGADLAGSTEIDAFRDRFPERFVNLGVAEQNAVGVAAGLAFEGLVPMFHSFGVFVTRRPYEQVCVQVAMERANVKLVGALPGLSSRLGPTHQAIDDLSLMRTLPGMTVVDPADATEMEQALAAVVAHEGPCYMRMMRREVQVLFDPGAYRFRLGRAVVVRPGADVTLVSTGSVLRVALAAAGMLASEGVEAEVVHVPTLSPLDEETVLGSVDRTNAAVTIENHLVTGGLGSAVAELLAAHHPAPLERLGVEDTFAAPGTPDVLLERHGLTAPDVAAAAAVAVRRRDG